MIREKWRIVQFLTKGMRVLITDFRSWSKCGGSNLGCKCGHSSAVCIIQLDCNIHNWGNCSPINSKGTRLETDGLLIHFQVLRSELSYQSKAEDHSKPLTEQCNIWKACSKYCSENVSHDLLTWQLSVHTSKLGQLKFDLNMHTPS